MVVAYVESNFILEIALAQSESDAATAILLAAERGDVTLVLPSYALTEPSAAVIQRGRRRRAIYQSIRDEMRDLARTPYHAHRVDALDAAIDDLLTATRIEHDQLVAVLEQVLKIADVIPVTADTVAEARAFRGQFGLELPDALVLASVVTDLRVRDSGEPSCFINQNWKDFGEAGVRAVLLQLGAVYLPNFRRGLEFCQPRGGDAR